MSSAPASTLHGHSGRRLRPQSALSCLTREDASAGAQHFDVDRFAHIRCTNVEALAGQLRDWKLECTQLSSGPFAATAVILPLDFVLLGVSAVNQSLVHCGQSPDGCLSIILRGRSSARVFYRGRELADGQCIVLSPRADAEWISHGECPSIIITLGEDAWRALAHCDGGFLRAMNTGTRVRTPGVKWTTGVLRGIDSMLDACRRDPEQARLPSFRASWPDLMMFRLLGQFEDMDAPRGDRCERLRRRTAVERARSFIRDNLTSEIRLADLCTYAHAQARSLEYGFREMLGMSPISYIRAMRLNRAHRLLLSPQVVQRTITEIALDCGFGHLSQFATDYRKLFGESPSASVRDARAALRSTSYSSA